MWPLYCTIKSSDVKSATGKYFRNVSKFKKKAVLCTNEIMNKINIKKHQNHY